MSANWFAGLATRPHLGRCVVASIVVDSPAEKAGLVVGDEILVRGPSVCVIGSRKWTIVQLLRTP